MRRQNWYFLLPVLATAAAVWANGQPFFWGHWEWWTLAVSAGYLVAWAVYLLSGPRGWQRTLSLIWWGATALCAAAGFCVVRWGLDGFLLIFPAMGLIAPLSGLAVLTGNEFPLFYGVVCVIGVLWTALARKGKRE